MLKLYTFERRIGRNRCEKYSESRKYEVSRKKVRKKEEEKKEMERARDKCELKMHCAARTIEYCCIFFYINW